MVLLSSIVAEFMLDVWLMSNLYIFSLKKKDLLLANIVLLPLMSLFYLDQLGLPAVVEIPGSLAIIFFESLIFYRIARVIGLRRSKETKLPVIDAIPLRLIVSGVDRVITILLPLVISILTAVILILNILPLIVQVASVVAVVVILLWSLGRYFLGGTTNEEINVERHLKAFLELFFVVSVLVLLELDVALTAYVGSGYLFYSSFLVLMVGPLFSTAVRKLGHRFERRLDPRDFVRIGPALVRYFGRYLYSLTFMIVIFSDVPAFYSTLTGDSLQLMFIWVLVYVGTAFSMVVMAVMELTSLRMRAGLIDARSVSNEVSRLSTIGLATRLKEAAKKSASFTTVRKIRYLALVFFVFSIIAYYLNQTFLAYEFLLAGISCIIVWFFFGLYVAWRERQP